MELVYDNPSVVVRLFSMRSKYVYGEFFLHCSR
jgi:hypothetical protein